MGKRPKDLDDALVGLVDEVDAFEIVEGQECEEAEAESAGEYSVGPMASRLLLCGRGR